MAKGDQMTMRDMIEDGLTSWAATYDASARLPELVRRLLLATAPLRQIEMRAGQGTRLGGFDGRIITEREGPFWPGDESVWELSVEEGTTSKLNRDYDKRVEELKKQGHTSVPWTYVAVTARMSLKSSKPQKKKTKSDEPEPWAESKKKDRFFRDVRLLDASDLAAWISQAPVVQQWFLDAVLRQPAMDMTDIGSMLGGFSRRTRPPLDFTLLCKGKARERAAQDVRDWATRKPGRLLVEAATRDEAAHFLAAALATTPNEFTRDTWANRTLIVWSAEALVAMQPAAEKHQLILIANFDDVPLERLNHNVRIAIPVNPAKTAQGALRLENIPWSLLAEALRGAGVHEGEAERIVRESGGSLQHLQALCGYAPYSDEWNGLPFPELTALLMVGAWVPKNEADRRTLQNMGGDPDRVDALCLELQRRGKIERIDDGWGPAGWKWQSPKVAWQQLADRLTDSDLQRFSAATIEVLGMADPVYDLPKGERFYAVVQGAILPNSPALRAGLATSLVMLSIANTRGVEHRRSKRSEVASNVLYRLFPEEQRWRPWASLSGLLPTLAEVAPDDFLKLLEMSLSLGRDGVCHLLDEEGNSGGGDPTPHVSLLWALEALGWSPEPFMMQRVAIALARLAAYDATGWTPGKVANRPMGSLSKILHVFAPQSRSTVEQRLRLIELLLADYDRSLQEVGWRLANGMVGALHGSHMFPSHQPQYRWDPVDSGAMATRQDSFKQIDGALKILIRHANSDPTRWKDLLEPILVMPTPLRNKVLDALSAASKSINDSKDMLRAALRDRMKGWNRFPDGERDPLLFDQLRALYDALEPVDPLQKHAWLFSSKHGGLPERVDGGWKAEEQRKENLRNAAIEELLALSDGWDKVIALSQTVEAPYYVGHALSTSKRAADVEERFLAERAAGMHEGVLRGFFMARFKSQPEGTEIDWIRPVLRKLLHDGRYGDAKLIAPQSTVQ
jgi:hypothetical protein